MDPLNIIIAFGWGAGLFGELDGFSDARFAELAGALLLILVGVLVIVWSEDKSLAGATWPGIRPGGARRRLGAAPAGLAASREPGIYRRRVMWAAIAGVLWGSYFVPAQWADVSAQASNFPLAIGILVGGVALALSGGESARVPARGVTALVAAGILFGIGNLALLGLVSLVGTGVGFTIAQLSLLVNASIGIRFFRVPPPGSPAARLTMAGILIAGSGGALVGAMR